MTVSARVAPNKCTGRARQFLRFSGHPELTKQRVSPFSTELSFVGHQPLNYRSVAPYLRTAAIASATVSTLP
jgi:hypothetical protein